MIHANNVNKFNIISSYGYHKIFNQDVDSPFVSLSVSQSFFRKYDMANFRTISR